MAMIKNIHSMLFLVLLLLVLESTPTIGAHQDNSAPSRIRRQGDGHDAPHPVCGRPTDSCMNNENWEQCRFLVEDEEHGCKKIVTKEESCPLQFVCMDNNNPSSIEESRQYKGEMNDTTMAKRDKNRGCVSLLVYKDEGCKIGPVRKLEFETFTHPGSACYTDATMPFSSVENQYCDLANEEWHQTYYFGTRACHIGPISKWWASAVDQTFTKDSCQSGLKLDYCRRGRCHRIIPEEEEEEGGEGDGTSPQLQSVVE